MGRRPNAVLGELRRLLGGPGGIRASLHEWRWQIVSAVAFAYLPFAVTNAGQLGRGIVVAVLLGALATAPIVLLAWRPWAAWAVAVIPTWWLGYALPMPNGDPWPWPVTYGLATLLAVVVVAITARLVVTIPIASTTALLFGAMSAIDTQVGWGVGVMLFALGGLLIRLRLRFRQELDRHEELSEVEKARRTILEERARIARDLHDVVAHRMSLVVVAAETAPYRVADVSEPMRAELTAISATAREALTELRELLGVLRSADEAPSYAPQPDLDDLTELVAGAARAGLQVELSIIGGRRPVRTAVELGAYRIVQEAMANAARHSPGARVEVIVAYEPAVLRLEITNGPPAPGLVTAGTGKQVAGVGHGLTGMAERAAVVGGEVHAAPTATGGFRVTATLPTEPEAAP